MKKIMCFAGICLAAVLSSCSAEELIDNKAQDGATVIEVALPGAESRTVMGAKNGENKYPVTWQAGDAIVVNGVSSTAISIKDPASTAAFTFGSAIAAPYCAVYPASAYVADSYDSANGKMHINIPAAQTYTAGSFDPAAGILVGYSSVEGNITFKQAVAYMAITVRGGSTGANIKSVKIWSEDHRRISGEFVLNCVGEVVEADGAFGGTSITLDCGVSGVAQGTPMVIALPAQNYSSGIKMLITDVDGNYQEITAWANEWNATPMVLAAGSVYPTTIPYTATALKPVVFPVYFPIGYAKENINLGTGKSTGIGYCNSANQTIWRGTSGNAKDGIHSDQINPAKGVFISMDQTQARAKWHWVNPVTAYRPAGETYKPFLEFTGGSSGSTTLISSLGVKGIWTGDYYEFDLPVSGFAAGTKVQFTCAICCKNAPTFWRVDYLDGDVWKTTAAPGCTAADGETTATATWAIPYNYAPKMSTTMTFENAIALGHLYIRLVCVDGSKCASGLTTVSTLSNAYCSTTKCDAPFYFCEKSAERNPDKTQEAWGNANIDQTQSISFTIVD